MTSTRQSRNEIRPHTARVAQALAVVVVATVVVAATPSALAQIYTVLHSFTWTDGAYPYAGLTQDTTGNFYGTTWAGGAVGAGAVFKLDTTGTVTVLHSFTGTPDGQGPAAGLVRNATGILYGTTVYGGASCSNCGTVFRLNPMTGKYTVLYSFTGGTDGLEPLAGLIPDGHGRLYGTTWQGGASGLGTVFKLNIKTREETVLHSFAGLPTDGNYPEASLIKDGAGNLYGTTYDGGTVCYCGTVFKLAPNADGSWTETVLHSFTWQTDGVGLLAGLVRDCHGNLYGTASQYGAYGGGTVFKLNPATGKFRALYSFPGGTDGDFPRANLIRDGAGNLYGTTYAGGAYGYGTVFELNPPVAPGARWTETILYSFTGATDGANPYAGLIRDTTGNLYGTASGGGEYGYGVIFRITP